MTFKLLNVNWAKWGALNFDSVADFWVSWNSVLKAVEFFVEAVVDGFLKREVNVISSVKLLEVQL